jgi:ArsR family transcriptional regulator
MSAHAIPIEGLLRALADRTRLRLMNLIRDQELCVCYLVEVLGISQPKISRHLAYLRRAGLVAARRSGYWIHYRIVPPPDVRVNRMLGAILDSVAGDRDMKQDRQRLEQARCAPERFVNLQGAPAPAPTGQTILGEEL